MKTGEVPVKYLIEFKLEVEGIVEENDVIGAIFGQTEGLLGPMFDLREMQKTGKIGRIIVKTTYRDGKTVGKITASSALDIPSTALFVALVESVNQIGPYTATISLSRLTDYRKNKVEKIIKRAQQVLDSWKLETIPKAEEVIERLRERLAPPHAISIGKEKLPGGPEALTSNEVILVEGRADVANLLKYGINNVLAIEGAKVPESIKDLLKGRTVIAFLDGDRGGRLNLKKLTQVAKVDYVAWAPKGKEVEELKPDEIFKALENKIPISAMEEEKLDELKTFEKQINEIDGSLDAILLDKENNVLDRIPVSELVEKLKEMPEKTVDKVIFDGVVTDRLIETASEKGVSLIIGNRIGALRKQRPQKVKVLSFRRKNRYER